MIELHERLSEFSYGYGVTRETELRLAREGIRAVPFLPSLVHEKQVGFDVAFGQAGAVLMLQFKLGQSLERFHRGAFTGAIPKLARPFCRFSVDTAEPDGQFETLLKAEQDGAEVYYVAPRFTDWPQYEAFFEQRRVLDNSLLVRPSWVRSALDSQGAPDGPHRIVYDRRNVHVCSEPARIPEMSGDEAVARIAAIVRQKRESAGTTLTRLFEGFDDRSTVRRDVDGASLRQQDTSSDDLLHDARRILARERRAERLKRFMDLTPSRDQAVAAAVGTELWGIGVQLVVAVAE